MAGNQTDNLMILDLITGLPRTPETGGTPDTIQLSTDVQLISGANMLVDGDLTVNGTTTTIHSEQVNIRDNHLYLNADYTTTVAQTGGFVVNVLPTATADSVAGAFTAGVAATSNPTVVTTGSGTFAAGDVIQIAGANDQGNDNIYEVLSHVGTLLTIRGVGTVGATVPWVANDFQADTVVAGDIRVVNVNVLEGDSSGNWNTATVSSTSGITYNTLTMQGVVDLQEAYVQGNTITTSAGEGDVTFAGTETFVVTTSGGIDLNSPFDFDSTSFDVQMTGSNGFSIDGTAASNVSVTAGNLSLSTLTSGDVNVTSVDNVAVSAGDAITVDTANAADASGNTVTVMAGSSTAGTADGANIVLTAGDGFTTGTAGFVNITSPADQDEILLQLESTGTGANAVQFFTGTGAPGGAVTADAGSLYMRDTGTGGEVYVNTSTGSGTSWTLLSAGGGNSLQAAYAVGNTIVTNSTDGDLDVSGTEAISLDAGAASNFTVDSANLTLSTTTSGNMLLSSAGLMDVDSSGALSLNSSGSTISIGNDAVSQAINIGTGGTRTVTIGSGNGASGTDFFSGTGAFDFSSTVAETAALMTLTTTGTGGDSVGLYVGDNSPSGAVTADAGSLFMRDTGTGGELWLNTSTGSGTSWTNISGGGGVTDLQTAYVGGNTIVTDSTNGDLDVSGTEAISLDAQSASNFTVAGAALSLGTTTSGAVDLTSAGILDIDSTGLLSINSSGGAINIGDDAVAQAINIGTGAAARTVSIGNTTGATAVNVDAASGGFSIDSAGGASNVSVDSANLTISTTTSGNIAVDAADNAAGAGGQLTLASGSSTGAGGAGGGLIVDAGDGNGTGNGGLVTIDGGNSGAGATGNGGGVSITAGDAISTNGTGADVTLTSGTGTGTGAGGDINLTLGNASGSGTQGSVDISGPNDEGEALVTLTTTGTAGDSVQMFVGDSDPNGSVTGLAGSLFLRDTGSGGELYINESTGSGTVWRQVVTSGAGGGLSLQTAYVGGNTIVMDSTNGDFDVSGTEAISLDASAASNFTVAGAALTLSTTTSGNIIANSAGDVDVDAAASINLDAATASNFTVATGVLTLSTTTSGNVNVTSADAVVVQAGDEVATAGNFVTIDAGDGGGSNDGGAISLTSGNSGAGATGNGGNVNISAGDALSTNGDGGVIALDVGANTGTGNQGFVAIVGDNNEDEPLVRLSTTGTGGDSVQFFVGDSDPNGSVTGLAGSLFMRDTGTGGELYINESTGSGTVWRQVVTSGAGGGLSLQTAYVGGNTIVTDSTNGDFDVSGTEAISLDASAASNFTVAGANLTLATTTSGTVDITGATDIQMTFGTNNATAMVIDDGTNNFVTFDSTTGDLAVEMNQFVDLTTGGGGVTLTAAATIAVGDIVTLDTAGEVILADSNTGTDEDAYAIGVAATAATATNPIRVYTTTGILVPINFAAAPGAATNGEVVFVSATAGEGTITPPTGMGNVLYKVGILQGADGASTNPLVLLQPQYLAKRP